jgi:hypothetical protein
MRDTLRATDKRVSELKSEAAEPFETTIVENRVFEALGTSDRLRQLVDVAERAYRLEEDDAYTDDVQRTAFGAAEDLNDYVDEIVDREVACECAAVIDDADSDWFDDVDDQAAVREAFDEACAWLADHRDAAEAEGIEIRRLDGVGEDCDETDEADEAFDPADYDDVREALLAAPNGYGVERILDHFDPIVDEEVSA